MNRRELGIIGENMAADILEKSGYKIICRNYRCRMGEIDIVAENRTADQSELCFIEVKTRSGDRYGRPCEAVDRKKQERIRKAASCYLRELEYMGHVPKRISFDIMEITAEYIKHAF